MIENEFFDPVWRKERRSIEKIVSLLKKGPKTTKGEKIKYSLFSLDDHLYDHLYDKDFNCEFFLRETLCLLIPLIELEAVGIIKGEDFFKDPGVQRRILRALGYLAEDIYRDYFLLQEDYQYLEAILEKLDHLDELISIKPISNFVGTIFSLISNEAYLLGGSKPIIGYRRIRRELMSYLAELEHLGGGGEDIISAISQEMQEALK